MIKNSFSPSPLAWGIKGLEKINLRQIQYSLECLPDSVFSLLYISFLNPHSTFQEHMHKSAGYELVDDEHHRLKVSTQRKMK